LTFTIRRSTATIFIALVGVLGGLAFGQIARAFSTAPTATASLSSEQTLREINNQLRGIHKVIGNSQGVYNILGQVEQINRKTP
jgi:hypothetical protein